MSVAAYDLATQCPTRRASMRRHTIVVCDASASGSVSVPQSRPASRQTTTPTPTNSDESIAGTLSWSRSSLQDEYLHSMSTMVNVGTFRIVDSLYKFVRNLINLFI